MNKCELVKKLSGFNQSRFLVRSDFGGANQRFVVSGGEDYRVYIWDRQSGNLLWRLDGHDEIVNCVHWSSTNTERFASCSDNQTVIVRIHCVVSASKS